MIVAAATVPGAPLLLPGVTGGPVQEAEKAREAMAAAVTVLLDHDAEEIVVLGAAPTTRPFPLHTPGPESRLAPTSGLEGRLTPGPGSRVAPSSGVGGRLAPDSASRVAPTSGPESGVAPAPGGRAAGEVPGDILPVSLAVGRSLLEGCPVPWTLRGVARDASADACRELGRELAAGGRPTGLLVVADGSARRGEKAPGHVDPRAIELDARIGAALAAADAGALLRLDAAACERALAAGRAAWQVMAAACEDRPWRSRVLYEEDPFGVAYWVVTWS
ncbi:hypothetical protein [Nonomuraea sp. NPDC048826]|uniref:hypothetical protein n=1 Tax=Nonomuraea sp. NPDC048826 TaxID=3364347 RepID=UPI0037173303